MTPFWKEKNGATTYIQINKIFLGPDSPHTHTPLRREGGSGVKKTSLAYIKVQLVIELLLTESQNLRL